ncbi:MAG TPA: hypothetical protein ENJ20_00155 [Bacteroidetes bacterium]|nr:hypothetical protein [Bacteroidota bacterium]
MKNLFFFGMLVLLPTVYSFTNSPTKTSLADELVGIYTGMFAKDGHLDKAWQIKVVKVADNVIEVMPFSGSGSQSFKAKVREDNLSAIRVIRFDPIGDVVLKNAMMTPVNGRLSYGLSIGGGAKLEVFSGIKK